MQRQDEPQKAIYVRPENIELDATLNVSPAWWARIVEGISRLRHQSAITAIAAIVGILWLAGVTADHSSILCIAMGAIALLGGFAEWIGGKYYGSISKQG
jgi:hypothetical protein